ncbi:hypothetical protein ACIA47_17515 [Micromonospora sp. NPDC051227]|uniref:hypothetical protein n=1 Tax=Micromonospora sp. NPDC051227 TaxID=3364285 RepID=UPI00379FEC78
MDDLVTRLSNGEHQVRIGGPDPALSELRRRIDEVGLVFIAFSGPHGATELGVVVDREATDVSDADWGCGTGQVHIEGNLTLNRVPIRCVADIDLSLLTGVGRVVPRRVGADGPGPVTSACAASLLERR